MKFARFTLPLLVLACDGMKQPVGHVLVTAQTEITSPLTRVTVSVAPANVTTDLTVDPQDPTRFTGTITVPVGTQTVTAEAFVANTKVGSGNASVTVTKDQHIQAFIRILDTSGPIPGPDHSPVVTSLVTPAFAQVGDPLTLTATAQDADHDALSFSWVASPVSCGSFASPTASPTTFIALSIGTCTVTFTATANGKSDSRSARIEISPATGVIDVTVTFVPQPEIDKIAFSTGSTTIATALRSGPDATIRAAFHTGTAYTVTLTFDAWPTGTIALSDSCAGTIAQPVFVANATSASGTWTPTVSSGPCILAATLTRETLADTFFVVVLPVP
jgi:hypothetical protein